MEQGPEFQEEVFNKVERASMLGLRSQDPAVRDKFAALYGRKVPATLFGRLEFIMCHQDWAPLAGTFWLKHALVGAAVPGPGCTQSTILAYECVADVCVAGLTRSLHRRAVHVALHMAPPP